VDCGSRRAQRLNLPRSIILKLLALQRNTTSLRARLDPPKLSARESLPADWLLTEPK
jgi:hypothetical protein